MTTLDIPMSGVSETEHSAQLRRALIASTVGTTIEWYDFLLYGQVTGLVFGKLFFPQSDPIVGVLQAFAVFFARDRYYHYGSWVALRPIRSPQWPNIAAPIGRPRNPTDASRPAPGRAIRRRRIAAC